MALNTNTYGYVIDPLFSFCDQGGKTIANGYVRVFRAGTSTPVLTYRNYDGAFNAETIELDNSGRTMTQVIASKGDLYKVCVYDAEHSQEDPILTVDKVAVIGASVNATNIIQGMNDVAGSGWIKSVAADDTAEVSLDATNVTSEVDTMAKATAASADYMVPLVHKTGSDPDKKITLGNIFKFVLNFIHSLTDTATDFASDDYIAIDGITNGSRKMAKDVVLSKTAKKPLEEITKEVNYIEKSNFSPSFVSSGYTIIFFVITSGCKYKITNTSASGACNVFIWDNENNASIEKIVNGLSYNHSVEVTPSNSGSYLRVYFNVSGGSLKIENLDGASKVSQDLKNLVNARKIDKFPYVAAVENNGWESGYFNLGVGIGNTVGAKQSNSSFVCQKIACLKGDCFVVTGKSGNSPRLWGFVDSSDKLVSVAVADITGTNVFIEAPADGYVITNANSSYDHHFYVNDPQGKLQDAALLKKQVGENKKNISCVGATEAGNWVGSSYIALNVGVGNSVSWTPVSSGSYRHKIINVNAGDYVFVRGQGGSSPRLWGFVDSSDKLVSVANSEVKAESYLVLVAPVDGKLVVNDLYRAYASVKSFDATRALNENQEVQERLAELEGVLPPMVKFERSLSLRDVSTERAGISYSGDDQNTILDQVYALFDGLVSSYSGYVNREDAATVAGESYPEYANGVETEGDYLVTPAYKMYAYKFVSSSQSAGNTLKNKKKKLFIISGVHGNEIAAPFNAYLFAKALCEATDPNFFALRAAYDVYIIPCVNGYGMYHLTRVNANGVNINRNMPIAKWTEGGAGTLNYTGPSAGSEFESKVIVGYFANLKPDVAVDHHNYGDEMVHDGYAKQYYIDISTDALMKIAYQQLVDLSFTYIKDMPQYFGTSYHLFVDDSSLSATAPARLSGDLVGTNECYFNENGAISATIEICNEILFSAGVPASNNEKYSADCFSVGDYMLRTFVMRLAEYGLSNARE